MIDSEIMSQGYGEVQETPYVVYEVLSDAGEIVYVGKSKRHQIRWKDHADGVGRGALARWVREGNKPAFKVLCYCETEQEMTETEAEMIDRLNPRLNTQRYSTPSQRCTIFRDMAKARLGL
jgi:excinuclease UvrABC nuclease subunit